MVTREDLLDDDKKREAEEKIRQNLEEANREFREKQRAGEELIRANNLLSGELGESLKRWNRDNRKSKMIKIYNHRVCDARSQLYDDPFHLNIIVKPDSPAINLLIKHLEDSGFKAFVETEKCRHFLCRGSYESTTEDEHIGFYDEYSLVIDWS